jgi:hypothetical protein
MAAASPRRPPLARPIANAGAPSAGTDEVWTLTFAGTPTGGTFRLKFGPHSTGNISWSATNDTLRDNVDAALEALPNIGAGGRHDGRGHDDCRGRHADDHRGRDAR